MTMHARRLAIIASIAAVALAGCNMTTVGTAPATIGTPAPAPSKIKLAVLKGCGFVPTAETIASILTESPFVPAIGAVAEAICTAVTTIPFADGPGDRVPRVNGVAVKGYFVKARLK